ncbi:MAG: zf-HC2 domain-containing protein [Ignavibacteriales bacterium]|nr:zf-HC2 domain-containing protein [Ignavibacteriales bacterium]
MNCKNVSELITAVLDGELRADERPSIEQHLEQCTHCRNEFELHRMAKRIVQQRLPRVVVPPEVQANIFAQLHQQSLTPAVSSWFNRNPFRFTWKPVVAFAGALAMILLVMFFPSTKEHHSHAAPSDSDIIHQTYNNFDKMLAGSLLPQISSNDVFDVQRFFEQKASFKVNVPEMKRCRLVGGIFSNYNDAQVAHVLYEYGSEPIYFYQVKLQDVLEGKGLVLPEEVKEELLRTGMYVRHHSTDCTLIVRIVDSTVCCTMADINKEELLDYITENK